MKPLRIPPKPPTNWLKILLYGIGILVAGVFLFFVAKSCQKGRETAESRASEHVQQTKKKIQDEANDSTTRTPDADVRDRVWADEDVQRFGQGLGKGRSQQDSAK